MENGLNIYVTVEYFVAIQTHVLMVVVEELSHLGTRFDMAKYCICGHTLLLHLTRDDKLLACAYDYCECEKFQRKSRIL